MRSRQLKDYTGLILIFIFNQLIKFLRRNNPEIDPKAGGFDEDDDEYEERRERISEAVKKSRV